MEQRRFFTRRDLPFFAGLLALGGLCAVLLALSPAGTTAVVEVDGQVVLTRELSQLAGTEEVAVTGAGGLFSTVCMWLLLKKAGASLSVVGVCGALAHNAAQLCVAYAITATPVVVYLPFLLVFGVLSGLLTGLVLKLTLPPLSKLRKYLGL